VAGRGAVTPSGAEPDEAEVEVLLLGTVEARRRGKTVHLQGTKQRTLLAALALEANHVVPDERLIELLWPEEPPDAAGDVLRVHVSKLRKAIEHAVESGNGAADRKLLVRKSTGYQLSIPSDHVDLVRCRNFVSAARRATEDGDDERALQLLDAALALWRGDPLPEFGNEAFAVGERSLLEKLRLETLEQRFDAYLRLGLHSAIVGELETFAGKYPLRERLQSQLILALYRCGRQAEASDVYHRTRKLLSEDLGMEPGPELQARFREILNQDPAAAPAPEVARPRPNVVDSASKRHNLPARLSTFIGREGAVNDLVDLVGEHRLVTLVGPGGIGKTRLSLQVGEAALADFEDGVWLVDLAPVTEPDLVPQAVLVAMGLRQLPDLSLGDSLTTLLEERRVLLVIDNCEHLIDAVAETVHRLLQSCPRLTILATSRERLDIAGEQVWPVSSLSVPPGQDPRAVEELRDYEAIRLFVERARMARPTFDLTPGNAGAVVEICSRLDGIPLALELAAARIAGLALDELVDRLGDRFRLLAGSSRAAVSRHRTMRETLDWSTALLSEEERTLFYRLGVFAGDFNLTAVEAVCSDDALNADDMVSMMARLVDKSLVVFESEASGEGRYRLLETMREYVQERIADSDRGSLRERHARHYLAHGMECERLYFAAQAGAARQRYDAEYSNARSALEWSHEADPGLCLEIAGAWRFYWWLQGLLNEGREWLERALEAPGGSPRARAQVLSGLGRLRAIEGDLNTAIELFSDGLAIAESAKDEVMVAELTNSLGVVTIGGDTNGRAEGYFRTVVDIWERVGYREGLATAYGNLGECCFYSGKYDEARARYLQQIDMGQEISRYYGLVNLSHLECYLGNYVEARARAAQALSVATPLYAAVVIEAFTFLAAAQEQAVRAATLSAAVARLYALRGAKPDPMPQRDAAEARLRDVISRLDDQSLTLAHRRGADMSLEEVTEFALTDAA